MSKIEGTFLSRCREAIIHMRDAGINETLIACIIQDIRSAALSEEYRRISELIQATPPTHHRHGEMAEAVTEWAPRP